MPEIPFDVQFPTVSSFFDQAEPWVVVDVESATEPGEQVQVLGRFATEAEASEFIAAQPDQDKVERGGFGLDGPVWQEFVLDDLDDDRYDDVLL